MKVIEDYSSSVIFQQHRHHFSGRATQTLNVESKLLQEHIKQKTNSERHWIGHCQGWKKSRRF